ncbi:MAG: hypothetical protein AAF580_10215 [Pseudomonadota bacterium]
MGAAFRVQERCETTEGPCGAPSFRAAVLSFVQNSANSTQARIDAVANEGLHLVIGQTSRPVDVDLSEDIKTFLDTAHEAASKEETELTASEITAKVKREDDDTLTIDGKSECSCSGTGWVAVSMQVDLVDLAALEGRAEASYERLTVGALQRTSLPSEQVMTAFPAGFTQRSVVERYREIEADNAQL